MNALFRSRPVFADTVGDIAAKFGADLGLTPDPEQQWLLDSIFAVTAEGYPAAKAVCAIAPRQNLKSATLEIAALFDLFVLRVPLGIWTAHQFKTARKAFEDMRRRILANPELEAGCKFKDAHGQESITLHTGETLEFHARSGGSGRGFSADRITLDEALYLRPTDMGALSPTLITRPDAQIRLGSSAGFADSGVLRGFRDRGRSGTDPSLAYAEYGAERRDCPIGCFHAVGSPGCALDERGLWEQANPALWSGRFSMTDLADQRQLLPPEEFAREFLTWWEDPAESVTALDLALWEGFPDPDATPVAPTFAVCTAPDHSWTAIGVHWTRPDGLSQVMLSAGVGGLDYRPPGSWVRDRVNELRAKWGGTVVVDTASRGMVDDAQELTQAEQAIAHNAFASAVEDGRVRHGNQPALNMAVKHSRWRPLGDTRVLDRKANFDISPLVAVALAANVKRNGESASYYSMTELLGEGS